VLTILDMWGREWQTHFPVAPHTGRENMSKLVIGEMTVGADRQATNRLMTIVIDPLLPGATQGIPLGEMVIVSWRDQRSVGEIEGVIELQSDKIVPITWVRAGATQ
jgi:hypothetical protein